MRINWQRLVAVALLVLLPAAVAFPWGSISPLAETHQYIVDTALNRLMNDPAFGPTLFPVFSAVKSNEGIGMNLEGPGADGNGKSDYSKHYYNPRTNEGGAPDAVKDYFSKLIQANLLRSNTDDAAGSKEAAYSAHFLADIGDPYHVNGASIKTASKIWVDQRAYETMKVNLSADITGLPVLNYSPTDDSSEAPTDFYTVLSRFIILTDYDWFDPWYYNGDPDVDSLMTKFSSHILWEARPTGTVSMSTFHESAGQGRDGYDPHWKNAAPNFKVPPWDSQAEQARQFTIFQATQTRNLQGRYFDDATLALGNTIRAVYTLWRASFSGLRLRIVDQPDGTTAAYYRVTGQVINVASAAASDLHARLTTTDCTLPDKDNDKELGNSLPAVPESEEVRYPAQVEALGLAAEKKWLVSASWRVQPETGKTCKLRLEVTALYSIPDLQYAKVEKTLTFSPKQVAPVSQPKPPEGRVPGATFWVPAPPCSTPKCPAYQAVPTPAIPPGAKFHGRWTCNRGGFCTCAIAPFKWEHGTCWATGPSRDAGCEYDGKDCGSMNAPHLQ
jgi:hypothetical protein